MKLYRGADKTLRVKKCEKHCNISRGSKSLKIHKKIKTFAIYDPYFYFMSQRRPQVWLSSVKNIIIQNLMTYHQKMSSCVTTFGLSRGKT